LRVEFCTGTCEDITLGREAEESSLLEAVARERLTKTKKAGKGLAGAVVICKVWKLAAVLHLLVMVNEFIYQPIPLL
jgi:hypothetical protein